MKTITKDKLKSKRDSIKDFTLINTLSADQFKNYKIEGSINVPQDKDDFVQRVSAAVNDNKDSEIVVYCASKQCDSSTKAARKLEAAGFTNVFDYEGGAEDWNTGQTKSTSNREKTSASR